MRRVRVVSLATLLCFLSLTGLLTAQEASLPAGPVYVIPIQGEISPSLMVFIRRSTEEASREGAGVIVFDIDTFGGRVDSALQITTIIGSLTDIHTVAYVTVRPEGTGVSWSAGALISFAADAIWMAPGTSMGSAAPIIQGPDGSAVAADEKTVSAVRTQMAALAEKNGYPIPIARAMVDFDVEVIELLIDGVSVPVASDEVDAQTRRAEQAGSTVERGRVISAAGKLLSLTAGEMERYGVSSGTVGTLDGLLAELGAADRALVRLEPGAADEVVSLLTGSGLTSLLILVGLIALFAEITSPGFGLPGTVGILCFAVIFITNGLLGRVGSVELLLFLTGVVLLAVEILVIPGFGVAGVSGIALMAAALVLSMQSFVIPTFEWEWQAFHRNILLVVGNMLGALVAFGLLAHFVPRFRFFSRLVLAGAQTAAAGYTAQETSVESRWLGARGVALTTLRPSGKAEFGEEVIAVESDGDFVDRGDRVEVYAVNGNRVLVRRIG